MKKYYNLFTLVVLLLSTVLFMNFKNNVNPSNRESEKLEMPIRTINYKHIIAYKSNNLSPIPTVIKSVSSTYNSIQLSWTAASGVSGYEIYRSTSSSGSYTCIATTTSTTFKNVGLTTGSIYYYKVRAFITQGTNKIYSNFSTVVSVKTTLETPSNISAVSTDYDTVKMSWRAVEGASGYEIYRAETSTGTYSLVFTSLSTSYSNTGIKAGTTYFYKIRAYTKVGVSKVYGNFSIVVSSKPIPTAPNSISGVPVSYNSIKLSWGAVNGASGYEVYRNKTSSGNYTLVSTTATNCFTNSGLAAGTNYYFKVRAYTIVGTIKVYGNYSTAISIKTKLVIGNTAANINNEGRFVFYNGWLYTNTLDGDYILRVREDGTEKQWLNFKESTNINVTEKYIYFISETDNNKIYRMNLDGTSQICIDQADEVGKLIVYGSNIYYTNYNDSSRLYRMDLDGKNKKRINLDTQCTNINITLDSIYYTSSGSLFRVNLDGSNKKNLYSGQIVSAIVSNGYIFFNDYGEGNNLFRLCINGTGLCKLNDDKCGSLNISGNTIYYININDNDRLYAIRDDGKGRTLVDSRHGDLINIADNYIYYTPSSYDDWNETNKTKIININDQINDKPSNTIGNLGGNLSNGGFASSDGKYIYNAALNDSMLYRYNSNLTNKLNIGFTEDQYEQHLFLNSVDGWVYYASTDLHTTLGNERIYKIKADGSKKRIELSPNRVTSMIVIGNWIYYSTDENGWSGYLHKMKVDGTGDVYLDLKNMDYATNLNYYNGYIYYINQKDSNSIYKVKVDGSDRQKISNEDSDSLNVINGFIYFSSSGDLKKMPVSGGSASIIKKQINSGAVVTENRIYYVNNGLIYYCDTNGKKDVFITRCEDYRPINVSGNYLWYMKPNGYEYSAIMVK